VRKITVVAGALLLGLSISGFAQDSTDPVFICAPPAAAIGCSGDPNTVSNTTFGMYKNGSGDSASPWYLILALPDYSGSAPSLTNNGGFSLDSTTAYPGGIENAGDWGSGSTKSLYDFVGLTGDSSMNVANLFGPSETAAFGGSGPSFFDVFVYQYTPDFASGTAYTFDVGGTGLPNGTFVAVSGGSNPFSVPFTTAGVVDAPVGSPVPEPTSIVLFGSTLVGAGIVMRKRLSRRS
jgi:hypothetical protein